MRIKQTTPMKLAGASALALGLMVGAGQQANAATVSFQEGVSPTGGYAMDATYIRSGAPDDNQNADPDVELIVGTTAPTSNDALRGLFEFDVSAIPVGDQIDSASLVLTTHATSKGIGGSQTFNLHAYGFDIDEATATWNAPGAGDATPGGTLGALLSSATFDVTQNSLTVTFSDSAAFQTAVSDALAGDGMLRLILVNSDESITGSHKFARLQPDNSATAGARPELIVTHSVPEPGSLALMGLGGLCLLKRRRRDA